MNKVKQFDSYEISLCFLNDSADEPFWERHDGGAAPGADFGQMARDRKALDFSWTLYGRREGEGAEAFFDAHTLAEAVSLYESITGLPSEIDPSTATDTVFFLPARTA